MYCKRDTRGLFSTKPFSLFLQCFNESHLLQICGMLVVSIGWVTLSHQQQSNLAWAWWVSPSIEWICTNLTFLSKWKEGERQGRVDVGSVQYSQQPQQAWCLLGSTPWASAPLPSRKTFCCGWCSPSRAQLCSSGQPCTLNLSWLPNHLGAICTPSTALWFSPSARLALPAQWNPCSLSSSSWHGMPAEL